MPFKFYHVLLYAFFGHHGCNFCEVTRVLGVGGVIKIEYSDLYQILFGTIWVGGGGWCPPNLKWRFVPDLGMM